VNLPGFPITRPRRLRTSPALRRLVAETSLTVSSLVLPLFARSGRKLRRAIDAMLKDPATLALWNHQLWRWGKRIARLRGLAAGDTKAFRTEALNGA